MRSATTRGFICLDDPQTALTYRLAHIDYTLFEDETFRYVIIPNYSVIALVGPPLFQGIPGINLDLHCDRYVRENRTPVFVSERTPAENREDVRELLDAVGMEYLDRLEWLIRTDTRYGGDNLYVVRAEEGDAGQVLDIDRLLETACNPGEVVHVVLAALCRGDHVAGSGFRVGDDNRFEAHALLRTLDVCELGLASHAQKRPKSVAEAPGATPQDGRRSNVDEIRVFDVMERYDKGRIDIGTAMSELGMSRATFFRWLKRFRERVASRPANKRSAM